MAGDSTGGLEEGGASMDPFTLRFSDPHLEQQLRASQFVRAKNPMLFGFVFFFLNHMFMSWLAPKYHVISAIYMPVIVAMFVCRLWLERLADKARAHELFSCAWMVALFSSNAAQRLTLFFGVHPRSDLVEATLYMSTYVFVVIILHLQCVDFAQRMAMLLSILA